MKTVKNEEDLAKELKNNANSIEITGDLKNKVISIKAQGDVTWVVAFGVIAIGVVGIGYLLKNKSFQMSRAVAVSTCTGLACLGPAVAVLGLQATISAVLIGAYGGDISILTKLRTYEIVENDCDKLILKRPNSEKGLKPINNL